MTSRFRHEVTLTASPDQVMKVLNDPTSHAARYEAAGASGARVTSSTTDASGTLTIVSQRAEGGPMPRPLAKLVRGAAQLTQTERWAPVQADGSRRATWTVVTKGVPVDIGGTTEVRAVDGGTVLLETGTITARVPLLSALIEKVAAEQSAGKLALEWEWLRGQL